MKIRDVIKEMPLQLVRHVGNWNKNSSFKHETDRKLLTNPKAIQKMHQRFAGGNFDFIFYFVNSPEGGRFTEVGFVNWAWLEQNMPKLSQEMHSDAVSGMWKRDAIVVVFTNNKGDERYMMTPWIIAHRIGHALQRKNPEDSGKTWGGDFNHDMTEALNWVVSQFARIMAQAYSVRDFENVRGDRDLSPFGAGYYDDRRRKQAMANQNVMRRFMEAIGKFKSARDGNLRNYNEFMYESLAQYLLTGKVSFNALPEKIPVSFSYGRPSYAWLTRNEHDQQYYRQALEETAEELERYFESALGRAQGKILVM